MKFKNLRQKKMYNDAQLAYKLYMQALADGMSNQQALDRARLDRRILVSDNTVRKYVKLIQQEQS